MLDRLRHTIKCTFSSLLKSLPQSWYYYWLRISCRMWLWIWKKSKGCIITKSHALEFTFFISEAVLLNVSILNVTELENKACEGEWQVIIGMLMIFIHTYNTEWVCKGGDDNGQDVRTLKLGSIGALFLIPPSIDKKSKQSCVCLWVWVRIPSSDSRIFLSTLKIHVSYIDRNKNTISK